MFKTTPTLMSTLKKVDAILEDLRAIQFDADVRASKADEEIEVAQERYHRVLLIQDRAKNDAQDLAVYAGAIADNLENIGNLEYTNKPGKDE